MVVCFDENEKCCFETNCFEGTEFDSNNFVSIRRSENLYKLWTDLISYSNVLTTQISMILYDQYIEFFILTDNVKGFEKYLNQITFALQMIKSNVSEFKSHIQENLLSLKSRLERINDYNTMNCVCKKAEYVFNTLRELENLESSYEINSSSTCIWEKTVYDAVKIQYYLNDPVFLKHVNCKTLHKIMENRLESLNSVFFCCLRNRGDENLFRILRLYSVLNEKHLGPLFRQTFVRPFIKQHLTSQNLTENGVKNMYKGILDFVSQFHNKEQEGKNFEFDLLVIAIWEEVADNLLNIPPTDGIYSTADPQSFHKNYIDTIDFLQQLELNCVTKHGVMQLHNHSTYKEFIKKWNLDAYYHMRSVEICGELETSLATEFQNYHSENSMREKRSKYMLKSTEVLWKCVDRVWDDDVFLPAISHQFWKLTMQLLSRYRSCASFILKQKNTSLFFYNKVGAVIVDLNTIIKNFRELFFERICMKVPRECTEEAFLETSKLLQGTVTAAESAIAQTLADQSCNQIRCVLDVPKLFRRTNRDVSAEPSKYASNMVNLISEFQTQTVLILSKEKVRSIVDQTMDAVVNCWEKKIQDVIKSEKRMVESFKILSRTKNKPSSDGVTDIEKITRQLQIDIEYVENYFLKNELKTARLATLKSIFT